MTTLDPHDTVRASYDAVAARYAAQFADELSHKPLDRALLTALLDEAGPLAHVVDIGCGPGHVTSWLTTAGARAVGVDLSDQMVAIASKTHPDTEFRQGDMLTLPATEGEFDAAIAFYSLIHLRPGELPATLAEVHRVTKVGGSFLAAFHVGKETAHRDEWFDAPVDLDFQFYEIEEFCSALSATGFAVTADLRRSSYPGEAETTRGYVLARRLG